MRQPSPEPTDRPALGQERSVAGALALVGLLVAGLLVVSYPVPMLGVLLGLVLGLAFPRVVATLRRRTDLLRSADRTRPRFSG